MDNIFSNYRAGDFLIRLKNASMAGRDEVIVVNTKFILAIAKALKEEGFLQDVKSEKGVLTVKLARAHKESVISDLKLVSKPGLRVYKGVDDIKAKKTASSIWILSTPKGIMSSTKAKKQNMGGEVIAEIW